MKSKEAVLKIAEAFQQDVGYGRARIDNQTRINLDLSIGDVIEIEGEKKTAAVVWRAHPTDEGKGIIRIDNLTRKNAGTGLGERVKIRVAEVKEGKDITLAPLISKGQQIQFGAGIDVLIKKGLLKRPITKGDRVIIPGIALFGSSLPFVVINTNPSGIISISEDTNINVKEEAAKEIEMEGPRVSYEDIGGLHDEILKVREMIELPLKHPELFDRLGIDPPKGVLLHGPPGTGKTLIAKAVANESGANFYTINGPEIMCVDGDTKILTNPSGQVKAKDIFKEEGESIRNNNNVTIQLKNPISTYAFKDGGISKAKITHITKLIAPTYKLKISDGSIIKTSNNQPFLTYENGRLVWKRVSDLKEGAYVARLNNINTEEKSYALHPEKIKSFVKINDKYVISSRNKTRSIAIKIPEKTSEELMEFLGLLVSDGNISKKEDSITFANSDEILINRFEMLLQSLFGIEKTKKYTDGRLVVYSKTLVLFLKHIGFGYDHKLSIPGYFYKLPKEEIMSFIRGYFDGDGTVAMVGNYPTPKLFSGSRGFLQDLQTLLQIKLKISSKINLHKTPKNTLYELCIRGYEGRLSFLKIGATNPKKMKKLELIRKVERIKDFQDLPYPSILVDEIKEKLPYKKYRNKDHYVYRAGNITKRALDVLYALAKENDILTEGIKKEYDLLMREDIGWEKIESKQYLGDQELYDFTVDKDSFIGGPYFFLHNSKFYGQSEENLRKIFEEAEKNAPSIIFIDEIDAIAPKRSEVHGEVERRVVSQMLTLMDGLKGRGKLIVIGATNIPDVLDPALRRPGRFDREIRIDAPDMDGRSEILQIHTRGMPIEPPLYRDIVLEELKIWMEERNANDIDKKIKKSQERIEVINKHIENIDVFLENKNKEKTKFLNQNSELESNLGGLERKLRELQHEYNLSPSSKLEKLISSLSIKRRELRQEIADLKTLIQNLKSEIDENENKIRELREEIQKKEDEIKELKDEKARLKASAELFKIKNKIKSDVQLISLIEGEKEIDRRISIYGPEDPRTKLIRDARESVEQIIEKIKDKEVREIFKRGVATPEVKSSIKKKSVLRMLHDVADITYGYVGADLASLARESAMNALRRYLPEIDLEKPIPVEVLEKMEVTMDDFKNAHRGIEPSAMREFLIEVPKVSWDDIGGLNDAKQQLREAVEWPLTKPDVFKRMGITPPRGILLYGPPGTGKTLLAKAVASESSANFISIKGPEVMSKWVGESEKAVRELFKKARQVAPTIVFLDELDSIAPMRGTDTGSHVTDSVVNQLLTSIDGLESMEGVVVIGATNRPDIIDQGLLRPGRFDRLVLINSPDKKARLEIFKIHTKNMPLDKNVDLKHLADITDNYTGADIEALCREAAMLAIREDDKAKKVTKEHFDKAMINVRASINENIIKFYQKLSESLGSGIAKKDKSEKDIQYM